MRLGLTELDFMLIDPTPGSFILKINLVRGLVVTNLLQNFFNLLNRLVMNLKLLVLFRVMLILFITNFGDLASLIKKLWLLSRIGKPWFPLRISMTNLLTMKPLCWMTNLQWSLFLSLLISPPTQGYDPLIRNVGSIPITTIPENNLICSLGDFLPCLCNYKSCSRCLLITWLSIIVTTIILLDLWLFTANIVANGVTMFTSFFPRIAHNPWSITPSPLLPIMTLG